MRKTTLSSILAFVMVLFAFNASAQRNILVNGDFTQAFPAGWGTPSNTTITTKGLAPGSNASAYLVNGQIINGIANPGTDFTFECYFACASAGGTNRAFAINLDYAVLNLRVNPTASGSSTGDVQVHSIIAPSGWKAVGPTATVQYSTVGANGSLTDADAVLNVYRLQVVVRGWNTATPTYDVLLSAANSSTLTTLASNLNYFQVAGGKPTAALGNVWIIGNQNTGMKFLIDGVKIITRNQVIKFAALPVKTTADASFELTATSSAGLPVTYTSSNEAVATVSGSTVTIVGPGTTDIKASAAGDALSNAATDVTQTLNVSVTTVLKQTNADIKTTVVNRKIVTTGNSEILKVYTVTGAQVDATKALNPGLYIVKIGSQTTKVLVH